jgi:hypothetical protein
MRRVWVVVAVALLVLAVVRVAQLSDAVPSEIVPVVLVDGNEETTEDPVLNAYRSILQEEGIAAVTHPLRRLMELEPDEAVRAYPSLIFAEGATRRYPKTVLSWISRYIAEGGHILFVYDSGTLRPDGTYYFKALWASLTGVNYYRYDELGDQSLTRGFLRFSTDEAAASLHWPSAKLDVERYVVGYHYGRLRYPMSVALVEDEHVEVLLHGVTDQGDTVPVVTRRRGADLGQGCVVFANLPLGALKGDSDDLIARAVLRMFLLDSAQTVHISPTPQGIGGLVINWHVDASMEWENLPVAMKEGWMLPELKSSIHITAGEFCDEPDDGKGFDACGVGRPLTEKLMEYGTLGSHGGWGHNWYAAHLDPQEIGDFTNEQMEKYIRMNNECLASVAGYPIREYSAPNGVHPQPDNTLFLEREGVVAYYYAGDGGGTPNRTFLRGKMITPNVIAFPVMPRRIHASLEELHRARVSDAEVEAWMKQLADFAVETRTLRLWYSHPYDIPRYEKATRNFFHHVAELQRKGALTVRPMSEYADYLLRVVDVTQSQTRSDDGSLIVRLSHPKGLRELCLSVPSSRYSVKDAPKATQTERGDRTLLCLEEDINEATVVLAPR